MSLLFEVNIVSGAWIGVCVRVLSQFAEHKPRLFYSIEEVNIVSVVWIGMCVRVHIVSGVWTLRVCMCIL